MTEALRELAAAFGLLTRLPLWRLPAWPTTPPQTIARGVWAYPVVGATIGAIGALTYALATRLGLPPALAAIWTVAAQILATGALHEDGLADTADGLGGGRTPARKLEIMRDSRIGSFGAIALILSTTARITALAAIADPARVAVVLVLAGSLARAAIIVVLLTTRPARVDGLAANLHPVPFVPAALALVLPAVLLVLLDRPHTLLALAAVALIGFAASRLTYRHVGGFTGDVLGATALFTESIEQAVLF